MLIQNPPAPRSPHPPRDRVAPAPARAPIHTAPQKANTWVTHGRKGRINETHQRTPWQLLCKQINLVQEQDDARLYEPARIADRVEEREGFLHTVLGGVRVSERMEDVSEGESY
jgi:hypothetical protein